MKNWKDIVARLIVFTVITCIISVIGYALYMGGVQAFIMFVSIFSIVIGGLGIMFVIIWAFDHVFGT
jgi:phosphoglycerol transferase MdoB-like AlkP superfamily enzyme